MADADVWVISPAPPPPALTQMQVWLDDTGLTPFDVSKSIRWGIPLTST